MFLQYTRYLVSVLFITSFFASPLSIYEASAATMNVLGGGPTLRNAVDAANSGDTLVITDSQDYDCININKPITIQAASGQTPRVIAGQGPETVRPGEAVTVYDDGNGATLRGLHLIRNEKSPPEPLSFVLSVWVPFTIEDCTVEIAAPGASVNSSVAAFVGDNLVCDNCTFRRSDTHWAELVVLTSAATFTGCTFEPGDPNGEGIGILSLPDAKGPINLNNCRFTGPAGGRGIWAVERETYNISGCSFAPGFFAIYAGDETSSPGTVFNIEKTVFGANNINWQIFAGDGDGVTFNLTNNVFFVDERSDVSYSGSKTHTWNVNHCTFARAPGSSSNPDQVWFFMGGANSSSSTINVQNCIVSNPESSNGASLFFNYPYMPLTVAPTVIAGSNLWNVVNGDASGILAGDVVVGEGMDLFGDPLFSADGYHLETGSAAFDAALSVGVVDDIDGEARPQGAEPDFGADEVSVFLTPTATQTPTDTSSATATRTATPSPTSTPTQTSTPTLPPIRAERSLPQSYCFPVSIQVSIEIIGTAGSVDEYTVEEILPQGWTASFISSGGQWDALSRQIQWEFFDGQERLLTYLAAPSAGSLGAQTWGTGSEFGYTLSGSATPVLSTIFGDTVLPNDCSWIATNTPTRSPTFSPSPSPTVTFTATLTSTHTRTRTPSPTPTIPTATPTQTHTLSPTFTPTEPNAVRSLPADYTPGVAFIVTIAATPDLQTQAWSLEESPPAGWAVSNISTGGSWDGVNKKVKWGLFFDVGPRTLSYQVTSPVTETVVASFTGIYSADSESEGVGGDTLTYPLLLHPADTNRDWAIDINQMTAYAAAWKRGDIWPTDPNPIPIDYVTNVGLIWKTGEVYYYDSARTPPLCWISGSADSKIGKQAEMVINATQLQKDTVSTAIRSLSPEYYSPGEPVVVSVSVEPDTSVVAWALEEIPPDEWSIGGITEGGIWDAVSKKVKWGPFFDSAGRVFSYEATPPLGESGQRAFAGQASFDGSGVAVGGDVTISDGPLAIRKWAYY